MNFQEFQACYDEQVAVLKSNRDELENINLALSDARSELETVARHSRQSFSIKGELAQLEAAKSENESQYRNLIENRGQDLMGQLHKIKTKLVASCNKDLEAKYLPGLKAAMDDFIEIMNRYLDEEAEFNEKMRNDINVFSRFDTDRANASTVSNSFGASKSVYVIADQTGRIQMRK